DGFELCRLMKSTFETSHIPVVLLTSLSGKGEQMQGLGLGADDYLTKPFDLALLKQKIKTIIRNRESVRQKTLRLIKVPDNESILANEHNDFFLKKTLEVVHENMANPNFNKEEFASAMNVSSSLLYKKVKTLTDLSPSDFIKTLRMNYALELLQTKKYNVTAVSEMCGYSNLGYFCTVFKKHFGKTTTEITEQPG
ncbi:MAG TPA: helix-turn-helix domain-containing protein, partial [Prolixibacteraceae bacterium]|nr:helix-turn-helix domain-containing protein [Prolixibacteraceae bacterium]